MTARPYSPTEDTTIITMRQRGADFNSIAVSLGRPVGSVRGRATDLGITRMRYQTAQSRERGSRRRGALPPASKGHCPRCGILLAATPAPPGDDGRCVWCVQEVARYR